MEIPKSPEQKDLDLRIDRLPPGKKDAYFTEVHRGREELVESGEGRNLSVDQKQEILERVESGEIPTPDKNKSLFPGVDPKKMERDFEATGEPMKGADD